MPKSGCMSMISLWSEVSEFVSQPHRPDASAYNLLTKILRFSRNRPNEGAELVTLFFSSTYVDTATLLIKEVPVNPGT